MNQATKTQLQIGVLAAGAWGTALAANWAQRHRVTIWAREAEVVESINETHVNKRFLPDIELPAALRATGDLATLQGSDVLVLATPVAGLRGTLMALQTLYANHPLPPLVWVCKGFEPQTGLLPHQVVRDVLGDVPAAALSGPSFAQEVALGQPTALVAASVHADVRDALREIGISSDSVVDFSQARDAVKSRMPNLIVVDAEIKDDAFETFRRDLLREVFEFPFVEISPDDSSFDMSGFGEFSMAKVGRGNIREALGTAVMFELAKMM